MDIYELNNFLRVQPKYAMRSFFLSGESYAGVYIPMLSARLTDGIISGDFPNRNFLARNYHKCIEKL